MNINEQVKVISEDTFIEDYLLLSGVRDVNLYLNPTMDCIESPMHYDFMDEGYNMLKKNINGKIGLLIDSDFDGSCSSALIYNYLKELSPNINIKTYTHASKLHGLSDKLIMDEILQDNLNMLIIPDAGSNDYDEHKILFDLGVDILVTDHHGCDHYSNHAIIINNQLSPSVINKDATGTIVTWQFCKYVDSKIKRNGADKFIDLCAWSIVSDVVNTTEYENRAILHYGLQNTNNVLLLKMIQEFNGGISPNQNDLGWSLLPKANAIIRTDNVDDTKAIFYAMTKPNMTVQWQKGVRAKVEEWNIVDRVIEQCKTSQKKQADLTKKFVDDIEPTLNAEDKIIIGFAGDDLGGGYTGLVAGKIGSKFSKPCLLLRDTGDTYTGSGRSDIDIRKLLEDSGLTAFCSGHSTAFGIQIPKDKFEDFKQFVTTLNLSDDVLHDVLHSYDYNDIPTALFSTVVNNKALWGKGIKSPLFHIKPFAINSSNIIMVGNNTTLKIPLGNLTAIKFFCSRKIRDEFYEGQGKDIEIELIVELDINYWNDFSYPQMLIKEFSVKLAEPKPTWADLF